MLNPAQTAPTPTAGATLTGGDFHQVTVSTLAFGALAMASPEFHGIGALAPSSVAGAETLLNALRPLGVVWECD